MKDFKTMLAGAKLPERTVDLCLRGDLVADFEAAENTLTEAQENPSTSKEGGGVADLVERVEAIQAQMRESTYPVRFRALDRLAYRQLVDAHPPRHDAEGNLNATDAQVGFDRSTFFDALVVATVIDPVLSADEWTDLLGKITDRQYGELTDAAYFVNRDGVNVPFSSAVSKARRAIVSE